MLNLMLTSIGGQLIRNQLRKGLKPLIVRQLLDISKKSSVVGLNRLINTSTDKKGHDTTGAIPSYVPGLMDPQPKGPKTVKEFAEVESQKNWTTYGYDIGNRQNDRFLNRTVFFLIVTIGTVIVPYILIYTPDYKLYDWATREAYLELDRRERLGLPLIDKNLVDPNQLVLPSDEELGDTEIYL